MISEKPSISVRKYIRRGNGPKHETTSTLVLTSPKMHYVDVRVLLPHEIRDAFSQLEWAFAGTSHSTPAERHGPGDAISKPAHTVWSHWIDSDTLEEVKDEGDMHPQADGTVLETGTMTNPKTGEEMTYEELWEDLEANIVGTEKEKVCLVLRMEEPEKKARGYLIRIGECIQGLVRSGDQVTATRWQYSGEETKWKEILTIGSAAMPIDALFKTMEEGVSVLADGSKWICVEEFRW